MACIIPKAAEAEPPEPRRSRDVVLALAMRPNSRFWYNPKLCVCPNISHGALAWEADLLVVHKSRYVEEVEIKVSLQDWKADKLKWKFGDGEYRREAWRVIRRFWYACPMSLARRWQEVGIPDWAGVIGVTGDSCEVLREAEERRDARKLTDKEAMNICRLAAMRQWKLLEARAEDQQDDVGDLDPVDDVPRMPEPEPAQDQIAL